MSRHSVPLELREPLGMDDAREALRLLSAQRRAAEAEHRKQIEKSAAAEQSYRKGLAQAFVKFQGTAAEREANAKADVANLSYQRDLDAGLVKACVERLNGLDGERASLHRLIEFSIQLHRATDAATGGHR